MPEGIPYDHKKVGRIYIQQQMSDLWVGVKEDGTAVTVHPYLCRPVNQAEVVALDAVREQAVQKAEVARHKAAQVHINSCSPAELARAVRGGIGPTRAAKIIGRKPDGGYKSYDELEAINSDLGINWSAIATDDPIAFEV